MKSIVTEITNLYNKIIEFSEDYADVKDIFLDDNSVELLEDSIGVLKILNNSRKALAIIKFKYFLKGLNHESVSKESVERLMNYVDNQAKAEFVTNSLDKIILSNSKLACCIMGLMLNEMVEKEKSISQEYLIMLNGLNALNDFDVKNFNYLYKIVSEERGIKHGITRKDIKKCAELCNTTTYNIYLTLDVLEKYSLLEKSVDVDLDIDEEDVGFSSVDYDETYFFNAISEKLYMYSRLLFEK